MHMTVRASNDRYLDAFHGSTANPNDVLPRFMRSAKSEKADARQPVGTWRAVITVLLPFAAGYYLGYLYRTINALISGKLVEEFALSAGDLGILTAVLFLTFALIQLPLGAWLDRFGPRRVQTVLLFIAAIGAAAFACAQGFIGLVIGRALIGFGIAGALMAGLKGIVLWFPAERIALANGWFIALGALGTVTATAPAEFLMTPIGWRDMFVLLSVLTAATALLILCVVPEHRNGRGIGAADVSTTIRAIYCDARFWRLAPLSATCIGSAWALQGLWAAPWLADVEHLERHDLVMHLLLMAVALSASALILGAGAGYLCRRCGLSLPASLGIAAGLALLAQLALVLRWPVPTWLPWIAVSGVGAATVLSYAILAEMFPKSASGRANGALNLLHIGSAFAVQVGIGLIVQLWPADAGRYPPIAYQTALAINLALQVGALLWFVRPERRAAGAQLNAHPIHAMAVSLGSSPASVVPYLHARQVWSARREQASHQAKAWRSIALASFAVMAMISALLAVTVGGTSAGSHTQPGSQFAARDETGRPSLISFAKHSPDWPHRRSDRR